MALKVEGIVDGGAALHPPLEARPGGTSLSAIRDANDRQGGVDDVRVRYPFEPGSPEGSRAWQTRPIETVGEQPVDRLVRLKREILCTHPLQSKKRWLTRYCSHQPAGCV